MDLLLYSLMLFSLSTALVCLSYVGYWALANLLRRICSGAGLSLMSSPSIRPSPPHPLTPRR
jgi:hypothetical protein